MNLMELIRPMGAGKQGFPEFAPVPPGSPVRESRVLDLSAESPVTKACVMRRLLPLNRLCQVVLSLVLLPLVAGCSGGPTSGMALDEKAPDGDVEILTIDKDGGIAHQPGRFLQSVKRTDSKLVLVDCWASWCGPCKALAPILEDIKRERGDDIEVVKVDVDANPEIARFLNAEAIPDVRIYQGGVQVYDFVGLMPKAEIDSILKSLK